jgi:hypothetical protein
MTQPLNVYAPAVPAWMARGGSETREDTPGRVLACDEDGRVAGLDPRSRPPSPRGDVGNADRTRCRPDPMHHVFHVCFVEAPDGGEAMAAREGRLLQPPLEADERQGIGKGHKP